jgi:hypothetical protein
MKTVTLPNFIRWLKKHKRTAFVGSRGESTACPINRFLKSLDKTKWYVVGLDYCSAIDKSNPCRLESFRSPAWMRKFIRRIDENPRIRIKASEALAVAEKL